MNPDPNAARQTRSPLLMRFCSTASLNAMGIEAPVVLPYFWMLLNTCSFLSPSFFWINWDILRFAWWGMRQLTSSIVNSFLFKASLITSSNLTIAFLKIYITQPWTIWGMRSYLWMNNIWCFFMGPCWAFIASYSKTHSSKKLQD